MPDHRGMRDWKEWELQDRIARANRVGWPIIVSPTIHFPKAWLDPLSL